jgi:PEP-CTERM motif
VSPVSLQAIWVGNDLRGTATFEGVTYPQVGSLLPGHASGLVEFSGSTTAPLDGLIASSSAPFLFDGRFFFPSADPAEPFPATVASLFGSGSATVQFHRPTLDQPWSYHSATYQFDATPVPEPGTLLLFGTVLAGLASCRRKFR